MEQLDMLRFETPPPQLRDLLGADIVSVYVTLSKPQALTKWTQTAEDIRFNCLQTLDTLSHRRQQVQFDKSTNAAYVKSSDCCEVCPPELHDCFH